MGEAASGLQMVSHDGTRYRFDPGALCLELLYSGGPGELARHETLHAPDDLARWAARSRLRLDPARVRVSEPELAAARRMRDTLWRLVRARAYGRPEDPGDYIVVNEAAALPPPAPALTPEGGRTWVPPVTGSQVLAAFARDAVELLTGPWGRRIRECAAHNCLLIFVDTSRPGRRRWCAMERCGNRHKVRALRGRRGDGAGESTTDGCDT